MADDDNPRVLLAEDDADLRLTTRLVLERYGFEVRVADDGAQAWELLAQWPADVAVLDVVMPRLDGMRLVAMIRANPRLADLPIVLLTARDLPFDQIAGLDAGADDYVTKPFDGQVLAARLKAVLRRRGRGATAGPQSWGELTLDRAGMTVSRSGHPVDLTATEFRLLLAFADHPGQVLSRTQLLERVWGEASYIDPRVVDVTVQRLRAKVGAGLIVTFRGAGYKLVRP